MHSPLVSIIIAAYNAEATLPRCLDSVLGQTHRNLEVIIINDASTDGTQQILNSYAAKDSRIILLQMEKNSGAPAARNKGMEISKGEFMTVIDADDEIDADTIALSVQELMADKEIDLVTFNMILVDEDSGRRVPFKINPKVPQLMTGKEACYWSLHYDFAPNGVSRSPLEQSLPAKSEYGQHSDETVGHMVLLKARKVKLGLGKYYYYMNPTSVTHKVTTKRFDILDSRILLRNLLLKENVGKRMIRRLENKRWREFIDMCYFLWKNETNFNTAELNEIHHRMNDAYNSFHWLDLPLSTVLKPRFMIMPTFKLFYLQLSIIFKLGLIHIK